MLNLYKIKENGGCIMKRKFRCDDCGLIMSIPFDVARPTNCPECESHSFHDADSDLRHIREIGKRKGGGFRQRVRGRAVSVH